MSIAERGTAEHAFDLPEIRVEGRAKVTGAAKYTADQTPEGTLYAAYTTSPHPHARIVSVDVSRAKAVPGVRAVITGQDVERRRFGRTLFDWPFLVWDRALFIGDRVAAVAADTRAAAEEAAQAIEVTYEELPAILDPEAALDPDAPVLHPERATYKVMGRPGRGGVADPATLSHPNVQGHNVHEHGDLAAGFAKAARVFEHSFTTQRQHQGYLEPRAVVVSIEGDVVRVLTTNKAPFALRGQMAHALDLPVEKIVVDAGFIGGDFGGKGLSMDEYPLYFLARATGKPVKFVWTYADELRTANTRHAARITLKTGVDTDGRIVAHESRVLFDGGAYAAGKPVPTLMPGDAMLTLAGYEIPNCRVEATAVYTNQIPAGHNRAPGQPQNLFAAESHMDLIARDLGIDAVEFRLRNAVRPGGTDVMGDHWETTQVVDVLDALKRELPPQRIGTGRGIALGMRHGGRGKTSLGLTLSPDGTIDVLTGVADQGGGQHTLIQRVIAAELGIALDRVRVRRGTTAQTLEDPGIGGSRVTPVAGGAALAGARALRAKVRELAGRDGEFSDPAEFSDLVGAATRGGDVDVVGAHEAAGHTSSVYALALDVTVDRETGATKIVDALLIADTGTVINPVAHRGQLEGGFIFGLGMAVMEDLAVEDGRVTTLNLGDYKLPTIGDVPPLRLVVLEDHPGGGPFGAGSVGELANPGPVGALANAVHDACGSRVYSLPITSEKVLAARPRRPTR